MAILPIRKILNVERARIDKMLKNTEIQALIAAIGAGVGEEEFDVDKIRYDKVVLLADADVDGNAHPDAAHLLLPPDEGAVEQGHVYIAQPPLYSTVVGTDKIYLMNDAAKDGSWPRTPRTRTSSSA